MTEIVKKFNEIRDIEYRIPLTSIEADSCCGDKMNCAGKMILFKKWLDANSFVSRYRVCDFKWSDLKLPESVSLIRHGDKSTHVYLEIYLNNKWVDVDPTWDFLLRKILPVNDWDGINDCSVAVPILKKYNKKESDDIMKGDFDEGDIVLNGEFYRALNTWLEQNRR